MPAEFPKRPLHTRAWIAIVILVALSGYGIGAHYGSAKTGDGSSQSASTSIFGNVRGVGSAPPTSVAKTVDFEQFWDLWQILKTKYYKQPLDEQKMLYGAMAGLTASTEDPYTVFFEPVVAKEFSQSLEGKFEGIGAEIGIKQDQLQIIAPLPDSPSEKAGVLAGDAILAINSTSTEGMTVEQAVSLIRGKKGTNVTLSLGRFKDAEKKNPERFDVTIARDTIVVKSVRVTYLKNGIAHVQMTNFNVDTTDAFSKVIDEMLSKNTKGVILDMRNNPGGFLDRATAVAGEWVGSDIVVLERRQGVVVDEFHGTGRGRLKGMPTIILVNEGSASASEIVAGALQDYGVAKLVGKKTFGKGSVQDYTELKDGTAVKVTVAEWTTPKGRFINEIGIDPDVAVERTEEDYHADRDPQLEKAIELLGGSTTTATP
ncbi:MAG: S41 family peptidase [Patescibacteria group bacterium]|jgi:carboxyl-terminal processing protease